MICPKCNRHHTDSVVICDCGYNLEDHRNHVMQIDPNQSASHSHTFLKVCSTLFKLIAILGIIASIWRVSGIRDDTWKILIIVGSLFNAIIWFGLAKTILLLLSIETRQEEMCKSIYSLEQMHTKNARHPKI
ncbi:MAG: hypothetical protein JW841_10360 [Deltaproteobacteria bacterium]|nr:hypothetical protein [Deltaproteobacteria bacterium]